MDLPLIARILHVVAVVLWIGGVGFVTLVLLPALKPAAQTADWLEKFLQFENRFAWLARIASLLTGLTGFYILYAFDIWDRFAEPDFWWMYGMILVWAIFTFILFIGEPLFLERWLRARVARDPAGAHRLVYRLHLLLLLASLLVAAGAVAGNHGGHVF
jgi:putative copper export protein